MVHKAPFNIIEDLGWESLGRAVCIPRGPERGRLYDALDGLLSKEAREAHIALDNFLGDEEAQGIEHVIRFVYGLLTTLSPETCRQMVEMGEIVGEDELEEFLRQVTVAADLEYIPKRNDGQE